MFLALLLLLLVHLTAGQDRMQEAIALMSKSDAELQKLFRTLTAAEWDYSVDITREHEKKKLKAKHAVRKYLDQLQTEVRDYPWYLYRESNATLYRWFLLAVVLPRGEGDQPQSSPSESEGSANDTDTKVEKKDSKKQKDFLEDDPEKDKSRNSESENETPSVDATAEAKKLLASAKLCHYKKLRKKCDLSLEPSVMQIMGTSRDPQELAYYWMEYRNRTGRKYKHLYPKIVEKENKLARKSGHRNAADFYMAYYESSDIESRMANLMQRLMPLYQHLHAYVRMKLIKHYKNVAIKQNGPIPAHLLGNMYAQDWHSIMDIVKPYEDTFDITKAMKKKKMQVLDMFKMAEKFFLSLGMPKMTETFWKKSMFQQSEGKDAICHGEAVDFFDGEDFRIRMCTQVTEGMLETVHHEMGHVQYQMQYAKQPFVFRGSAHPGFHEAIGDTIALSVNTFEYQQQIGFIDNTTTKLDKKQEINLLLNLALKYLVSIPYAFVIDHWRHQAYKGDMTESDYNKKYWEMRFHYQGVCPPVPRTEDDFDIGAKYHIAFGVDYSRYFLARILQFQLHKELCCIAGHKGPIFKCNLFNKEKAGKAFSRFMALGKSIRWQESLSTLMCDGGTNFDSMSADAILEYFEPLLHWLRKQNKDESVGWWSDSPMKCPE